MGNFSFQSYDNSAAQFGAGTNGRPYDEEPSRDQPRTEKTTDSSRTLTPTREDVEHDPEKPNRGEKLAPVSSSDEDEAETQKRDNQILTLARSYSQAESRDGHPFEYEEGSILDVKSPNFKPRAWARALLNLEARDPEHYQMRTAGFAFKDLNVWGFGADTDYQKSVGNIFLSVIGLAQRVMGNKGRKIDILQHMDGVVEQGEMLVVLGPPGR